MRKIILSICVCIFTVIATAAQLTSATGKLYKTFSGIDYVFIFNGINNTTEVKYDSVATNVKWYKFNDPTPIYTGVAVFDQLENATGYILEEENGNRITFWVIDYTNYLSTSSKIVVDSIQDSENTECKELKLSINPKVPVLYYKISSGDSITIPRDFTISYDNKEWKTEVWSTITSTKELTLPTTEQITVSAPLCNTKFTLSGDQYAVDLGLTPVSSLSNEYTAIAVECHITTVVSPRKRDQNNEDQAPWQTTPIDFSAPIEVEFLSNANEPVAEFYNWEIYKDNSEIPMISRQDKSIRYTFNEAGTYNVKLVSSNKYCKTDTVFIPITVSESLIDVPNVFTPNGDGMNDEFRVAYRSIISFEAWVYNRWGRLVFHWTDPQKGWDGNINGRKAAVGPYYYVIKALGSDFNPESEPINKETKLRLGEYLKKGDINLLRGKE